MKSIMLCVAAAIMFVAADAAYGLGGGGLGIVGLAGLGRKFRGSYR